MASLCLLVPRVLFSPTAHTTALHYPRTNRQSASRNGSPDPPTAPNALFCSFLGSSASFSSSFGGYGSSATRSADSITRQSAATLSPA